MRADICSTKDEEAFRHFHDALERLGAKSILLCESPIGVDLRHYQIGDQILYVFCDIWNSLDIEGPDDLVQRVLSEMNKSV